MALIFRSVILDDNRVREADLKQPMLSHLPEKTAPTL
jgi:hypothetical protein